MNLPANYHINHFYNFEERIKRMWINGVKKIDIHRVLLEEDGLGFKNYKIEIIQA